MKDKLKQYFKDRWKTKNKRITAIVYIVAPFICALFVDFFNKRSIIGAFKEYESNYNELIKSSNLNSEYLMALSEYSEAIGEIVEMNLNKEEHPELEKLIDAKNYLDEVYAKIVKLCEERESGK